MLSDGVRGRRYDPLSRAGVLFPRRRHAQKRANVARTVMAAVNEIKASKTVGSFKGDVTEPHRNVMSLAPIIHKKDLEDSFITNPVRLVHQSDMKEQE